VEGLTKILKPVVIAADLSEIQTGILSHTSLERHRCSSQFGFVVMSNVRNPSQYRQFALEFCLCLSSPRGARVCCQTGSCGILWWAEWHCVRFITESCGLLLSASSPQSSILIYSCITHANWSWRLTSLNNPQNVIFEWNWIRFKICWR